MGTPVAIKMIMVPKSSASSEQFDAAAFEAEVDMLCQLRHPHICLILGVNQIYLDDLFIILNYYFKYYLFPKQKKTTNTNYSK